ncbi:MAG: hypothetical protein NVS2B9_00090 [Myxococcales bacterium]
MAFAATAFPAAIVPVTGQLVCATVAPGYTPTFPATVALVQVTAVPARTAKLAAEPSDGVDAALVSELDREARLGVGLSAPPQAETATRRKREGRIDRLACADGYRGFATNERIDLLRMIREGGTSSNVKHRLCQPAREARIGMQAPAVAHPIDMLCRRERAASRLDNARSGRS